ncbi:MAG: metallophosphoesterase [Clostridia bacterium]|nr:metallophosphoesterase [Clostridia bacterium]
MGKLFVIGDLHFSLGVDKPMDIFGKAWENHTERLCKNWRRTVGDEDYVVVNGDISWGLDLKEAAPDLILLDSLPGKKIIMKGNHELWWTTMAKLKGVFKDCGIKTILPLYNNAYFWPEKKIMLCGTRGWLLPGDEAFEEPDAKVMRRETLRLGMSLTHGKNLAARYFDYKEGIKPNPGFDPNEIIEADFIPDGTEGIDRRYETVAFLHYPPFVFTKREKSEITDIIEQNNIERCYFGHVHGVKPKESDTSERQPIYRQNGVRYYLTAADYLGMEPVEITGPDLRCDHES